MRTRVRNQFPRRREIHVDDDVDARARVPSSPSPTPTLARARRSSSTRTPLAPSRDDDTEASNGIRRRARAPTREIAARARARASSPLLDESRIDRDTPRDRRVPPIAVGKGTSRAHTRGGGGLVDGSRPVEVVFSRPSLRSMGDRARGLTSSTRGSWRGREPSIDSIDSIDRDETNGRKRVHRVDRFDRFDRFDRSIDRSVGRSVEWRLSGVCGVTRRRMHPRRDRAHSSSTSGAVVEAATRRDATRRDAREGRFDCRVLRRRAVRSWTARCGDARRARRWRARGRRRWRR